MTLSRHEHEEDFGFSDCILIWASRSHVCSPSVCVCVCVCVGGGEWWLTSGQAFLPEGVWVFGRAQGLRRERSHLTWHFWVNHRPPTRSQQMGRPGRPAHDSQGRANVDRGRSVLPSCPAVTQGAP